MTRTVNTVSAFRSLLQEEDYDIKEIGIRKLLANVSLHWTDIANDINTMYIPIIIYSASNSWKMTTSRTANWWPFCSPSCTSTLATMTRVCPTPCVQVLTSTYHQLMMTSLTFWSTSAYRNT